MMMTDTSSPETHNSGVLAKVCLIFMGSLCWLQPTNADEPAKREPIKVFISPECKDMFLRINRRFFSRRPKLISRVFYDLYTRLCRFKSNMDFSIL
jgi:hypothetical protein